MECVGFQYPWVRLACCCNITFRGCDSRAVSAVKTCALCGPGSRLDTREPVMWVRARQPCAVIAKYSCG